MDGFNDPERDFWGGDPIPRAAESRHTIRGQYIFINKFRPNSCTMASFRIRKFSCGQVYREDRLLFCDRAR